jgi:hypothetical protein
MRDLVVLAGIVGFFALAALVVAACDRIVGPDPDDLDTAGGPAVAPERDLMDR